MHVYGLTGGIGTGKSTVARMLAEKGAAVIDADRIAREVVEPGTPGLAAIREAFGPGVLTPEGTLDRTRLGEIVFADPQRRRTLEQITHPRIMQRFGERIGEAAASGAAVVVLDVPLLYETGNLVGAVEKIIVVYAPAECQLERVRERDGLADEQIRGRMAAQLDIEEKRRRADFLIENTGTLEDLRARVDALWAQLVRNG